MKSKWTVAFLALGISLTSTPAVRAADCKTADASLAAVYELRGVMEVGSLIQLHRDVRFQYMMTYGAADEVAEGCWRRKGQTVILSPTRMENNHGGRKFRKLELKIDPSGGLVRRFDATHKGTYARLR